MLKYYSFSRCPDHSLALNEQLSQGGPMNNDVSELIRIADRQQPSGLV